jgi:hypothetical protein
MRKNRILANQALYVVSSRTVNLKKIFIRKHIQKDFRAMIKLAQQKYMFTFEKLSFQPYGFRMEIFPKYGRDLSRIMQYILGRFAQRFNQIHKLWGHFWGDRFVSEIIDRDENHSLPLFGEGSVISDLKSMVRKTRFSLFPGTQNSINTSKGFQIEIILQPPARSLKIEDFKIKKITRIIQT